MARRKTTNCWQIDVREMKRSGLLDPQLLRWSQPELDRVVNAVVSEFGINISYRDRSAMGGVTTYDIRLVRTPCNIAGVRPWFLCPSCNCRVAILFSTNDGKFACRACLNLAYPSQSA